jgi:hypothetical protein
MNEITIEKIKNVLKEYLKEKKYQKIASLLREIQISSDYERGYYECVKGLIDYLERKNYEEFKKFNLYNLIFNDEKTIREYIKDEWDDEPWERGFKKALKDILEIVSNSMIS